MTRRTVGLLILLAWAGSVGWLARRQLAAHATLDSSVAMHRLSPAAAFYSVRLAGEPVGIATISLDTVADGLHLSERLDVELPGADSSLRELFTHRTTVGFDLHLRRIEAAWSGDRPAVRLDGGLGADSLVELQLVPAARGGPTDTAPTGRPVRFRAPVFPAIALPMRLAIDGRLAVGQTLELPVLDLQAMRRRPMRLTVTAESTFVVPDSAAIDPVTGGWQPVLFDTLRAWRLDDRDRPGVHTWVDDQGMAVRAVTADGYLLERTAFEIVSDAYRRRRRDSTGPDVVAEGIRPAGRLRAAPDRATRLVFALRKTGAADSATRAELRGGVQQLSGDSLVVVPGAGAAASDSAPGPEYLATEPLVPSADPRVEARARRVTAGTSDRGAAARRLVQWLNGAVADDYSAAAPDPLDAFERRRGGAVAQSLLYVALARSAGVPARLVSGIARVDGKWFYHTWAEVYVEHWVPIDPTFGRYPAAGVVRLAIGIPGGPLELAPRAARLVPLATTPSGAR